MQLKIDPNKNSLCTKFNQKKNKNNKHRLQNIDVIY